MWESLAILYKNDLFEHVGHGATVSQGAVSVRTALGSGLVKTMSTITDKMTSPFSHGPAVREDNSSPGRKANLCL